MALLGELKRRKIFQVAAVYLVVAWLIMQVVDVVNAPLRLPEWFSTVVILLLGLGFPIAMILSWAFDVTPEGVVRDEGAGTVPVRRGRTIEFTLIGLLSLAVIWLFYRDIQPEFAEELSPPEVQSTALRNSIAILPFDNLSPDPDDAYFAAGLHEEILNQLAKLRDLSVISRRSVIRYADSDMSIPEIAAELQVETVMEGSVRYANGRVRITAQLIDAATDGHLWSETYEREFADIFAVESDIATNIVTALEVEFSGDEEAMLSQVPSYSPEAYSLYLRATAEVILGALENLDSAIEADPEFAPGYALRAQGRWALLARFGGTADEWLMHRRSVEQNAASDLQRAIQLDPFLGSPHQVAALIHSSNWRGSDARKSFEHAYRLAPNDMLTVGQFGLFYAYIGEYEKAAEFARRVTELQPNETNGRHLAGLIYAMSGYDDRALSQLQIAVASGRNMTSHLEIAWIAHRRGDGALALAETQAAERVLLEVGFPDNIIFALLVYTYGLIGDVDNAQRLFGEMEGRAARGYVSDQTWMFAYLGVRDSEKALEYLKAAAGQWVRIPRGLITIKRNHYHDPILEQPEFVAVRETLGFQD
jgi:TolB-like protein